MDWYIQWFGNPYNWEPYYDYGYDMWYDNYVTPQMEQPQYYQDTAPVLGNVAPQQYLNNYADMYSQSNPAISQQYRNLANQAGMRWDIQRNILNWYDGLANDVANRQQYVTNISGNLANNLLWDINNQRDYIYSMYWPNGSITQEVNDYYSWLANAIAGDTGRQLAQNDVNAKEIGMSVGANRNAQNQIYNEGYERALKAKEADINAKNNIVSALQNYMSSLRSEYGDTTDKYIIQKYQQANDLLNQIQSSMTQDMVNLENSRLQYNMQRSLSWWNGGNSSKTSSDDVVIVDWKETKVWDLTNEQLNNIITNINKYAQEEWRTKEENAVAQNIYNKVFNEQKRRTPDVTPYISSTNEENNG